MVGWHTLAQAAANFARVAAGMHIINHESLEQAAQLIENEAKRVIGTYEYGWTPLSERTISRKGADTPLLETGEMRDSIHHNVSGNHAYIGSDLTKAAWHEFGTSRGTPPRPFLGGAAAAKGEEVAALIGRHAAEAILASLIAGRLVVGAWSAVAVVTPETFGQRARSLGQRMRGLFRRGGQ